jgi:hypothetical protein
MSPNRRPKLPLYAMLTHLGVLLGLIWGSAGCVSRTTRKTLSINRVKGVEVSAAELGSRNQSLLALYSSEIENAADKIIREAPSPITRREALLWKTEAIPVLQTSVLKTDAIAAVVDTWAFIFQMKAYMEQATMKDKFGVCLPVVSDTLTHMDREMEELVLTAVPTANIFDLRRKLGNWAATHPIEAGWAGRRSADPDLVRNAEQGDLGALASLNALQEGLGDVTARLDSYNAYLPKQARWQAELLIGELTHVPYLRSTATNFAVLAKALYRTSNDLDRLPEMANAARNTALADLENQRISAQSFLTQERVQVIEAMVRQRIAVMADLDRERVAATTDLSSERRIVLNAIHEEEIAAMTDLNTLSQQTLNDLDKRSRRLLNYLFCLEITLVLITIVVCFVIAWILLQRFTPRELARHEYHGHAA